MDKLGIEPSLLLAQVVNFTIILIVLNKLLYKPILAMLEKRKAKIEEGLKLTETLKEEEAKTLAKREKVMDAARKDAQVLIEEARKQAKVEAKELIDEAHLQSADIIEKGKKEADRVKEEMEKSMRKEAVVLAQAMTKRLVSEVLTSDMQHKLIAKHTDGIEKIRA